jgi:LAO/AO transport system kinase
MSENSVDSWVQKMLSGDRLALARLISKVENQDQDLTEIIETLYPKTGNAKLIGFTGPPGAGKSTLVDRVVENLRNKGEKVAVLAIDPSSPFTGGAVLGDRIRMQKHYLDQGVYIRSLGTRGKHGGLSRSTQDVLMVLDSAGFDSIIIETAGVGQTELDILEVAQTVVVVLVPESGDSIQVMKAGIMEIADLFVVNKADRPESDKLARELINMVGLQEYDGKGWEPSVCKTEALRDEGTVELVESIFRHQAYLETSGKKIFKQKEFIRNQLLSILIEKVQLLGESGLNSKKGQDSLDSLLKRETNPYKVISKLFDLNSII